MRVNQAEKEKSHRRIVSSAARMFRERGLEQTNVAEVMGEAGMTQGGFYRHFESKDALVREALRLAFEEGRSRLEKLYKNKSPNPVERYYSEYLSKGHLDNPGIGCPISTLANEISRESVELKEEFSVGVNQMIDLIAKGKTGTPSERTQAAIQEFAMMVGAVVIARACDDAVGQSILKACKK